MNDYYNAPPQRLPEPRRDTEITLGPLLQLIALLILVLIVAAAFGWGYSMGRHSGSRPAGDPAQTGMFSDGSPIKPSANAPANAETPAAQTPAAAPAPAVDGDESADDPAAPEQMAQEVSPQRKPAQTDHAMQTGGTAGAQPHAQNALMVQIAAVSHQEDADVLLNALRHRGYAVSSRRDPADGLIHVRLGPFPSRAEAESIKNKLLGDGYNAQVQ